MFKNIKSNLETEFGRYSFAVGKETEKTLYCNCRHWGTWTENDEELDIASSKNLNSIMKKIEKKYPEFYVSYSLAEKRWIDFDIMIRG